MITIKLGEKNYHIDFISGRALRELEPAAKMYARIVSISNAAIRGEEIPESETLTVHTVRVPYESSAGPAEADDGDESGNDSEQRDGNLTLPEFIYTTYNSLLENGWKMADIDGMDMLGYLKVRAWKAKRDQEKKAPVHRYIDEVWGNMKPNV